MSRDNRKFGVASTFEVGSLPPSGYVARAFENMGRQRGEWEDSVTDRGCEDWELEVTVTKRRPGKSRKLMHLSIRATSYEAFCKTEDNLLTLLEHFKTMGASDNG